jgi:hypothetical protein
MLALSKSLYVIYECYGPICYNEKDRLKYWNERNYNNFDAQLTYSSYATYEEAIEAFEKLESHILKDTYHNMERMISYSLEETLVDEDGEFIEWVDLLESTSYEFTIIESDLNHKFKDTAIETFNNYKDAIDRIKELEETCPKDDYGDNVYEYRLDLP